MDSNIKLIEGIVNEEWTDISLYTAESHLFKEKIIGGDRISETFINFAADENRHIEILLKLFPGISFKKRKIFPYQSLRKNLRLHLIREQESIFLYQELSKLLKGNKEAEIISQIIKNEETHLKRIKRYLFLIK